MEKLGAIALSSDIFEKANIGLWAFELDEGSSPATMPPGSRSLP